MTKITLHEIEIDSSKNIDEQITAAFEAIIAKHQAECPECKAEAEAEAKSADEKKTESPEWPFPKSERQPIGYAAFLNGTVIDGSMRVEKVDVEEIIQERLSTETGRILGMFFGVPEVKPVFGE